MQVEEPIFRMETLGKNHLLYYCWWQPEIPNNQPPFGWSWNLQKMGEKLAPSTGEFTGFGFITSLSMNGVKNPSKMALSTGNWGFQKTDL